MFHFVQIGVDPTYLYVLVQKETEITVFHIKKNKPR
jgi:hypothetical protein